MYLNHAGMIASVVSWPRGTVLHHPSFLWFFLSLCHQCINPYFELFILSLQYNTNKLPWSASIGWLLNLFLFSLICLIAYFHGPALLYKAGQHLVFQVIHLLREVVLRGPWLDAIFPAKRHPSSCKLGSFWQRIKKEHWCTIIRHITAHLVNRVIDRQDGKNCVGSYDWRFLKRVDSTHKDINWG